MCVIAVSPKGIKQPSVSDLRSMWVQNPHGGGYMLIRNDRIVIHKGFMYWDDFIRSVRSEHLTKADPVVYHFRISTQGGINPQMTHPFPITHHLQYTKALDAECDIAVAHNGIIPLTSSAFEKEYSDTALFVTKYLSWLVRYPEDINNKSIQTMIQELGNSKFVLMNYRGDIATIGKFYNHDGILLSNENHLYKYEYFTKGDVTKCFAF